VSAPAHTPTQPPVTGAEEPDYPTGATYLAFAPSPDARPRRFVDLPGAWRVAVEPLPASPLPASPLPASPTPPSAASPWPWRASLANAKLAPTWNRANVMLPAKSGDSTVTLTVALPAGVRQLRVCLLHDGAERDTRTIDVPPLP
jgi:hypothetical protein